MPPAPHKIVVSGRGASSLVAHIPHAPTRIPPVVREQILLDDEALQRELVRLTDWHTDHLFSWVLDLGGTMFVNELSRLVFDPERFADDSQEPMAARGQGVVYTHGSEGQLLARISDAERAERIQALYEPYHEGLTALVGSKLAQFGCCNILDCHSFATVPLQSELDQTPNRPDICIDTDAFHTPPELADELVQAFTREGFRVARDTPFAGTLVPLEYLEKDERVSAVMIEVRRGLYCDEETGERAEGFEECREKVGRAAAKALRP